MIRAAGKGIFPTVAFPPNRRSMIHVEDVVQACLLSAANAAACGQVYVLTDGNEYSTTQILTLIHETLGKKPGPVLPYALLKAAARLGDMVERLGVQVPFNGDRLSKLAGSARYSNAKICRELGFVPTWDLRRGIDEMVHGMGRQ
jgi:nucleoside-diphosphate-sugar epimerase